ncbi:MAG: hypothetical protein GXP49_15785 [Deltaproteobacteria bacterium]|nr:hypothetical protein [Deltaproteobacteria bacterium]
MSMTSGLIVAMLMQFTAKAPTTYALTSMHEIDVPKGAVFPALSMDGSILVYAAPDDKGWSLYKYSISGKSSVLLKKGLKADKDTMANSLLVEPISGDNRGLVYLTYSDSNNNGKRDRDEKLVVQALDLKTGKVQRLSSPGRTGMNPAWLPRRNTLCYTESGDPGHDPVLVVCRDGLQGPPRIITRFEHSFVYWLIPSPDGRRLALRELRAGDSRPRLVVIEVSSGRKILNVQGNNPASGMVPPRWSNDGKKLFFVDIKEKAKPDVFAVLLESKDKKPRSLGAGGCISFLVGPFGNTLLLATPRRKLPSLDRTVDVMSFDVDTGKLWRIGKDEGLTSITGKLAAGSTEDGKIILARLQERGVPERNDPAIDEILAGNIIWKTRVNIHDAEAPFAVYKVDHHQYPVGPDPAKTVMKALGLNELKQDPLGRPFDIQVLEGGQRLILKSKTYKGWYVVYDSKTRKTEVHGGWAK